MVPFGVNSDASFRAEKLRIRVRGWVFSHRWDSIDKSIHKSSIHEPCIRYSVHKSGHKSIFTRQQY